MAVTPKVSHVTGIGGSQKILGTVSARIYAKDGANLDLDANFSIITNMLGLVPSRELEEVTAGIIAQKDLADKSYHRPAPVEIILGAGVCAKIFSQEIIRLDEGLVALDTKLGYIIFGESAEDSSLCYHVTSSSNDASLDAALQRLWQMDDADMSSIDMTPDEIWCEENFDRTCVRGEDGRYVTTLSIRPESLALGDSFGRAADRFKSLERRLQRDKQLAERYIAFMREYQALGHMKVASRPVANNASHYYIPHHPVLKKFRVVFDASAKTTNGRSLNDIQLAGPRVQPELYDTILRFRRGKIALTADIAKMFRQVRIAEDQWDLQRILWRESPNDKLEEYWLTVITYGLTSAGYNAIKAMLKCAKDNQKEYPIAAEIVPESFYMDDMLASQDTVEEAKEVYRQVKASLAAGGFELTKWSSNQSEIIHEGMCNQSKAIDQKAENVSVLGLIWMPSSDELSFNVRLKEGRPAFLTKRIVASEGATIFDPNGYLTPVTIQAKIFMQDLWRVGVQWDEKLSPEVSAAWTRYYSSLTAVSEISLPRWVGISAAARVQLHTFCDASAKAYGTAIYIRVEHPDGKVAINLITSKGKVADLKTVSIPRLELCAARLAAETGQRIQKILNIPNADAFYWTDSEIVLHWLRKFPSELRVYVGNRVSIIQSCTRVTHWAHVESKENPADIVSRGLSPNELARSRLWWHGPHFLSESRGCWPKWKRSDLSLKDIETIDGEKRRKTGRLLCLVSSSFNEQSICLMDRLSSLPRILRVTAYVMRFIARCKTRTRSTQVVTGTNEPIQPLMQVAPSAVNISSDFSQVPAVTPTEYKEALSYWIKYAQRLHFPDELRRLNQGQPVSSSSKIRKFVPFIDAAGIIRMRGRLERASLDYDQKHPIILSGDSTLSKRLMLEAHLRTLHGGSQLCMQYLRDQYWIIGLRSAMRRLVRECVVCTIYSQRMAKQIMADLPEGRVKVNRPFTDCGVDYAGPFRLKPYRNSRGSQTQLVAYVAVFVCFSSKAVHLELVGDLTTQAFLAALDRMILRRSHVQHLYSDQGRNFIGAENELRRVEAIWQSDELIDELTVKGISWTFNTPLAPHHGGLWEAAVKSFKFHLYRTIGAALLTFEELNTLVIRIEGCLNSRPLVAPSDDPLDLTIVTPGHLIMGQQAVKPLGPRVADFARGESLNWNRIRAIEEDFWKRWSEDYLKGLQRRSKWFRSEPNIMINDLVVIKEDNMPPGHWKRGRVIKLHPSEDGAVRSVTVRTAASEYRRPITRLCILPVHGPTQTDPALF